MTSKYSYFHSSPDGKRTDFVKRVLELKNDDWALHYAIKLAREIKANGLTGFLVCEGFGASTGIPLDDIDSITDPIVEVEDEILEGYARVMEIYNFLWPWGDKQKCEQPLHFNVSDGVNVECSRPRGCLVVLTKGSKRYEVYHRGPSLQDLVYEFDITAEEARKVWSEVMKKLEAVMVVYS